MRRNNVSKKSNLDNTAKAVEDISNKVDIIVRNRLVIAILLMVDGITFILNPNSTLGEMAKNIIILVLFAAFSIFITNLVSKTKDVKTIVISLVILAVGAFFYIYPDIIAAYIQLILSLFIIYDSMTDLASTLNLNRLSKFTQFVKMRISKFTNRKKIKAEKSRNEKFKDVDKNINDGLEQQAEKLINPLKNIVDKTTKSSILFIIANVISLILGIILLIFPDISMMVWGIIFLYTGTSNLLIAAKTMNLAKKIRERKFKEILYDKDKK